MWNETGTIRKDPGGRLNVALVYPGPYRVGMSNLGFHQMYRLLNANPLIACERFFSDAPRSIESGRSPADFHIVAFSISYEPDMVEALRILTASGIETSAAERKGWPVVMAGGAAVTMNPEPIAPSCDICFLGDGETLAEPLAAHFLASRSREEFLDRLQTIEGVYLPSRTLPVFEEDHLVGFIGPKPRRSLARLLDDPARTCIVTQDTAFGDMYLVETARGCPFSCSFCSAREIYAPHRTVPLEGLMSVLEEARALRDKVGLVSTSLNTHPQAASLFSEITRRGLKIAPPSLRSGIITPELVEALALSGVKGVTLAPETGSDSLRSSIGKRVTNRVILDDVRLLVGSGIRDIKLYFMVGLPGETAGDLDETVDLIRRVREVFIHVSRGNRRIGTVNVGLAAFVPKPHTAFERRPMLEPDEASRRIRRIVGGLKRLSNVHVRFEGPKWAYLQSVISRGDRRVFRLLAELATRDPSSWHTVMRLWPLNPDHFALRARGEDEILPWSYVDKPSAGSACRAGQEKDQG